KVRCRLALLPFLISCLIWLDLVASLPLIKERILVIILLLHFLSLMLGKIGRADQQECRDRPRRSSSAGKTKNWDKTVQIAKKTRKARKKQTDSDTQEQPQTKDR